MGNGTITATFDGGTGSYMIKLDGGAFAAATSPHIFSNVGAGSHTVTVKNGNDCQKSESITINDPPAVVLILTKSDVTCNGQNDGSITATFSGGNPPYQIKLDAGSFAAATSPQVFNNLSPAVHTVTVKDANGCEKSASVTIEEHPAVTLSLSKTDITCNGLSNGTITATFAGGTGSYMITLDGGAFASATSPHIFPNVGAGSHTVTVKNGNDCQKSESITINDPPAVVLILTKS